MITILIPILSLALAFPALAQEAPKARPSALAEQKHNDYFKRIDKNGDGSISKEEYLAKPSQRFDQIDTNRDGKLGPQESRSYREAKKAERAKKRAAKLAKKAPASPAAVTAPTPTTVPATVK